MVTRKANDNSSAIKQDSERASPEVVSKVSDAGKSITVSEVSDAAKSSTVSEVSDAAKSSTVSEVSDAAKSMSIVRSSKFRHIEGKFKHRSTFISKLPSLSSTVPGDANVFQVKYNNVNMIYLL